MGHLNSRQKGKQTKHLLSFECTEGDAHVNKKNIAFMSEHDNAPKNSNE